MHKVILDTNVIISSILSRSYPYLIVYRLILQSKIQNYFSNETRQELEAVLSYPKFSKIKGFENDSKAILNAPRRLSISQEPSSHIELLIDSSDNKFVDIALSTSADFLITGNLNHFPFSRIENTEIISPERYWNTHWK